MAVGDKITTARWTGTEGPSGKVIGKIYNDSPASLRKWAGAASKPKALPPGPMAKANMKVAYEVVPETWNGKQVWKVKFGTKWATRDGGIIRFTSEQRALDYAKTHED